MLNFGRAGGLCLDSELAQLEGCLIQREVPLWGCAVHPDEFEESLYKTNTWKLSERMK